MSFYLNDSKCSSSLIEPNNFNRNLKHDTSQKSSSVNKLQNDLLPVKSEEPMERGKIEYANNAELLPKINPKKLDLVSEPIKHDKIEELKIIPIKENIKTYILDPLSVIIKLAILSKKKIGAKICILNNILYIQDVGAFQGIVRYFYKNNKDDIHFLYNPIELACKDFLSKTNKNIFISAQRGIDNLIETYKSSPIIVHSLYMYRNIISNYLGNNFNNNLFISDEITKEYISLQQKLNKKWTDEKIKILLNLFEYIDKIDIKCIEQFMVDIDNDANLI